MTVIQPSARPTNKLMVAAAAGPAVAEIWQNVSAAYLPALSGPAVETLVGTLAALMIGYMVKDRPNV